MVFKVIDNPHFDQPAGFTREQFRKLDQLYCASSSHGVLSNRAVDCDFDAGIAAYTYYAANHHVPYLQFVIRKVGPRTTMFEVFKYEKGRIFKSGVFDRALEKLSDEISLL